MANMFQREPEQHDQEQVTKQTPMTSTGYVGQPSPSKQKQPISYYLLALYFPIIDNLISKVENVSLDMRFEKLTIQEEF